MIARIGFAVGGLLFGCAVVVAVELLLRVAGVAAQAPLRDPFAGFSDVVPVFEPGRRADGTAVFRLSQSMKLRGAVEERTEPQREFLATPEPDVFRIFIIGGSSAAGHPYTTRYAFSWWLQRRLEAALPEQRFEVVNAALSSYASRRLLPVVEEIAQHQPDLLIVYMGHNELAESRYFAHLLELDPRVFRLLEAVYRTRIYALAASLVQGPAPAAPEIDLDALDNAREMFAMMRDRVDGRQLPTERELAYRDLLYEHNLRAMLHAIRGAGGRVMLVSLSQNFSDWAPAGSSHRPDLTADELAAWSAAYENGRRLEGSDCAHALDAYRDALAIDDTFAELHYRMGRCQRELGDLASARDSFRRASDLDRVPHGAPTSYNELLRALADEDGTLFADAYAALAHESGDSLVGDDLFTDFAHPNLRAHQVIAAAIAEALRAAGVPRPADEWRDVPFREPTPAELYRDDPALALLELKGRVFVCIVAPRDYCAEESAELLRLEPDNWVAQMVSRGTAAAP